MHKGVLPTKSKEIPDMASETAAQASPEKSKMFPVVLTKNYRPVGEFEIIGYLRPEIKQKDAAGIQRITQTEKFIEGEMKPHESPGVGFPDKIWAGTHVRLPVEEAKRLVAKKLAERADAIAA